MKPTLKAHGTNRLKLKYERLPSSFGFKFILRRYTMGPETQLADETLVNSVGRCRLTLSNPS